MSVGSFFLTLNEKQGGNRSAISKKEFFMNTQGYSSISWSPQCGTLLFPMNPSHAGRSNVRGQQSDCDDNVRQCSGGRLGGVCLGENVFWRVEWGKSPVLRVMSCHISCNPSSPALKTLTLFLNPRSLLLWQPHRRPSKPDTPPITPYPSSPWLFVMAWLGLFRGKLTMSGILGVMKKMKLGVVAQKSFEETGEETRIKVQLACSLTLKPL